MTRVIAGVLKGRRLATPEGMDTRPTMDRTREALFGSIQFEVPGARFLDLFAGSGAVGIEAMSRGAVSLDLVEKEPAAVRVIRQNLKELGLTKANVWPMTAESAIRSFAQNGRKFDLIFMDPPYCHGWEELTGNQIAEAGILADGGMLIIESSSSTDVALARLECFKIKTYKTARFSFFRNRPADSAVTEDASEDS